MCDSHKVEVRHDLTEQFRYLKQTHFLAGQEHAVCLDCGCDFFAPGQIARNNDRFLAFEKTIVKDIAPREVTALRERYGISQEEAAKIFHTGKTAFSKWERGEVAPTGPTALFLRMAMTTPSLMAQLAADAEISIAGDALAANSTPSRKTQNKAAAELAVAATAAKSTTMQTVAIDLATTALIYGHLASNVTSMPVTKQLNKLKVLTYLHQHANVRMLSIENASPIASDSESECFLDPQELLRSEAASPSWPNDSRFALQ